YVGRHHERAAPHRHGCGYLSGRISVSRFNRRLHQLADWMAWIPDVLGEVFTTGDVFIIDSLPLPVCRRVRARRCRKAPGRRSDGWCVAKRETFFGWRAHLVCRPDGVPVRVQMLPAGVHDLTTSPARGGMGGVRLACLPGRGCRAIKPTTAPLMRRASWRRRGRCSSCDQGRPCVRTAGVWTPSNCD
ncbi:MAG: hypothetical protein J7466_16150, partial [Roseiflexus sp.]|nr:hypothetical protein [Roseiflexus sp.]